MPASHPDAAVVLVKPTLNVYALPRFVDPQDLAGGTAVVIDVLRAATTIVYALAAGAKQIIPCLEISDALALAAHFPADEVLLGGEREGLPIEGFQLGNSPEEYSPEQVGGKTIIFTTTNGTRAMARAEKADEILVAAFVNASAVVRRLFDREYVNILCAGTDGRISRDDVLLAGLLVERLLREGGMVYQQNGQAITAREAWLNAFALPQALGVEPLEPGRLAAELRRSLGGQNLTAWAWKRTSSPPPNSTASRSCRGSIPGRVGSEGLQIENCKFAIFNLQSLWPPAPAPCTLSVFLAHSRSVTALWTWINWWRCASGGDFSSNPAKSTAACRVFGTTAPWASS